MNYGKEYMGILRTTFVIDKNGVVKKVFEKVHPEGHALDDTMVYRLNRTRYLMVVNASNEDQDWAWLNLVNDNLALLDHDNPHKRVLVPEVNLGQLSRLLRAEYLVDAVSLTQVSGIPFRAAAMESAILQLIDETADGSAAHEGTDR